MGDRPARRKQPHALAGAANMQSVRGGGRHVGPSVESREQRETGILGTSIGRPGSQNRHCGEQDLWTGLADPHP